MQTTRVTNEKSINISYDQRDNLINQLKKDYPLSVVIISWKTKETLGFTFGSNCLEFDDTDSRFTMFSLKYSDFFDFKKPLSGREIVEQLLP